MKKLFMLLFFLSFCIPAVLQAQRTVTSGVVPIYCCGNKILENADYNQSALYLKAKQWLGKRYECISAGDFFITIEGDFSTHVGYTLLLEFHDGEFKYTFSGNRDDLENYYNNEQQLINKLTKYLRKTTTK